MKIKVRMVAMMLVFVGVLTACKGSDVVGDVAKTSFRELLKASPDQIQEDEMNGGWSLTAPDGSSRFIWSEDYSKSPIHDVMVELDSAPFIAAGLDVSKLPEGIAFDDKLMLGTKLGKDKPGYKGESTPKNAFDQIVKLYRESIGYHENLDHYGVDLGSGNKFEWAKDMSKNDKDIVFVLNPEMLIEAGVDPEKIEGWVYASVEMMNDKGKKFEEMKLLKPFDIK